MATDVESTPDAHVTSLLSGIAQDARRLVVEQLTLFQVEMKNDMQRMVEAIIPLVAGAVMLIPAILLLGMAAAHGISWAIPEFPTWAGFAIVGSGIAAGGGALVFWGVWALRSVSPVPDTALQGLKENLQWKTKR